MYSILYISLKSFIPFLNVFVPKLPFTTSNARNSERRRSYLKNVQKNFAFVLKSCSTFRSSFFSNKNVNKN